MVTTDENWRTGPMTDDEFAEVFGSPDKGDSTDDKYCIEELADGWYVKDTTAEPSEQNHWGYLCGGCPDKATAEAWRADYLLEEQCREWERHSHPADDWPVPF